MTQAVSGKKTRILRNYDVVAELSSIGDLEVSRDDIDATHYDSDSGFREYIPGLKDGGELQIEGNFIPGDNSQTDILTDYENGTNQTYILAFPNTMDAEWLMTAYPKNFNTSQPQDDKVSFSATMKLSGKPKLNTTGSGGLSDMAVSGNNSGALSPTPSFSNSTYVYSVTTGSSDTSVDVTPTYSTGTSYVEGTETSSGVAQTVPLGVQGTTTQIFIVQKDTDEAVKIYKILVYRPAA